MKYMFILICCGLTWSSYKLKIGGTSVRLFSKSLLDRILYTEKPIWKIKLSIPQFHKKKTISHMKCVEISKFKSSRLIFLHFQMWFSFIWYKHEHIWNKQMSSIVLHFHFHSNQGSKYFWICTRGLIYSLSNAGSQISD